MDPIKVLYVAGKGRSGSTVLDTVLGEVDGFFAAGEVRYLWEMGLRRGFLCGCGRPVLECELWSKVVSRTLGTDERGRFRVEPATFLTWYREIFRWRSMPRLFRAARRGHAGGWGALEAYAEIASRLYAEVARLTEAKVVIDSAKWVTDPVLLGLVPGVEAYCLHLVRDPRAVVHSWKRRRFAPDRGAMMDRYPSVYSAVSWVARNLVVERGRRVLPPDRYLRVRYEDFVAQPGRWLGSITRFLGEPSDFPFLDGNIVRLGPNHTVSGNPHRYTVGTVELHEDDAWRAEMGAFDRAIATLVSLPVLGRYGYPVRTRDLQADPPEEPPRISRPS